MVLYGVNGQWPVVTLKTVWYGMVWYGIVWYGRCVVLYGAMVTLQMLLLSFPPNSLMVKLVKIVKYLRKLNILQLLSQITFKLL